MKMERMVVGYKNQVGMKVKRMVVVWKRPVVKRTVVSRKSLVEEMWDLKH